MKAKPNLLAIRIIVVVASLTTCTYASAAKREVLCTHPESRSVLALAVAGDSLNSVAALLQSRGDYFLLQDPDRSGKVRSNKGAGPNTTPADGFHEIIVVSAVRVARIETEKELLFLEFDAKNRLTTSHCELAYTGP